MTKFKQFGKLPGRPSELIRSVYFISASRDMASYRMLGFFNSDKEETAKHALNYLMWGRLSDAFEILGLKFPKTMKPKVYVDWVNLQREMLDMARQLEERGY